MAVAAVSTATTQGATGTSSSAGTSSTTTSSAASGFLAIIDAFLGGIQNGLQSAETQQLLQKVNALSQQTGGQLSASDPDVAALLLALKEQMAASGGSLPLLTDDATTLLPEDAFLGAISDVTTGDTIPATTDEESKDADAALLETLQALFLAAPPVPVPVATTGSTDTAATESVDGVGLPTTGADRLATMMMVSAKSADMVSDTTASAFQVPTDTTPDVTAAPLPFTPEETPDNTATATATDTADDGASATATSTTQSDAATLAAQSALEAAMAGKNVKKANAVQTAKNAASGDIDTSTDAAASTTGEARVKEFVSSVKEGTGKGTSTTMDPDALSAKAAKKEAALKAGEATFTAHLSNASTHAATAAAPAKATTDTATTTNQTVEMVSVQLAHAVETKTDRMTIQLRPRELGNIEVQMDFSRDGRVQAAIIADRPETLDLLRQDSRALERALNDTGLQANSGSLSFSLRQQGGGQQQNQQGANYFGSGSNNSANENTARAALSTINLAIQRPYTVGDSRLDITV